MVLHSIPVAVYLFMPFLLRLGNFGLRCWIATLFDFIKGKSSAAYIFKKQVLFMSIVLV